MSHRSITEILQVVLDAYPNKMVPVDKIETLMEHGELLDRAGLDCLVGDSLLTFILSEVAEATTDLTPGLDQANHAVTVLEKILDDIQKTLDGVREHEQRQH